MDMFSTPTRTDSLPWPRLGSSHQEFAAQSQAKKLQRLVKSQSAVEFTSLLETGNLTPESFHDVFVCISKTFSGADKIQNLESWTQFLLRGFNDEDKRRFLDYEIEVIGRNVDKDEPDAIIKVRQAAAICKALLDSNPSLMTKAASQMKRNIIHEAARTDAHIVIRRIREESSEQTLQNMILEQDQNHKSALELAIENGKVEALKEMLNPDRSLLNRSKCGKPALLKTAIANNSLPILEVLLEGDLEAVDLDMLSLVVRQNSIDIFDFLVQLRPCLLKEPMCCLLHEAVDGDQIEIARRLVKLQPDLTGTFKKERHGENELDRPVLYYTKNTKKGKEMYNLVLPILIERNPVSIIRRHLSIASNKELCLDLSPWKDDNKTLEAFLDSVYLCLQEKRENTGEEDPAFSAAIRSIIQSEFQKVNITVEAHDIHKDREFSAAVTNVREYIRTYIKNQQVIRKRVPRERPAFFDLEFESILKYIQLPLLPGSLGHGNPPVNLVLDWLRECKGVRRIFEVRVDDCHDQPHSEEDIEKALRRFSVTDMDWRCADLSVYTIMRAAPQIKRLHLYSSGNLGTLDHWLGRNGLRRLTRVTLPPYG